RVLVGQRRGNVELHRAFRGRLRRGALGERRLPAVLQLTLGLEPELRVPARRTALVLPELAGVPGDFVVGRGGGLVFHEEAVAPNLTDRGDRRFPAFFNTEHTESELSDLCVKTSVFP